MSKRNSPSLPHNSTCRTVDRCLHISRMVWCKYTYPSHPPSRILWHCFQVIRDKMVHANELLYASKIGSQTSSEWFRESQKWRSNEVVGIWKHTVLNITPWRYVYVLVYWPISDTIRILLQKDIRVIDMEK